MTKVFAILAPVSLVYSKLAFGTGPISVTGTPTAPLYLCIVQPHVNGSVIHTSMQIPRAIHVIVTGPAIPMRELSDVMVASHEHPSRSPPSLRYVGTYLCSKKEHPECLPAGEFSLDKTFLHSKKPTELIGIDEAHCLWISQAAVAASNMMVLIRLAVALIAFFICQIGAAEESFDRSHVQFRAT